MTENKNIHYYWGCGNHIFLQFVLLQYIAHMATYVYFRLQYQVPGHWP